MDDPNLTMVCDSSHNKLLPEVSKVGIVNTDGTTIELQMIINAVALKCLLIQGANNLEDGNLSGTLNDLERASARMPAILTVFEDSLVQLTTVKDSLVRERVYSLLERSLLHCPRYVGPQLAQRRKSYIIACKDEKIVPTLACFSLCSLVFCLEILESFLSAELLFLPIKRRLVRNSVLPYNLHLVRLSIRLFNSISSDLTFGPETAN